MDITELLNEFTPSRTQFSQILNDDRIRMGFECEMLVDHDPYDDYSEEDDDEAPDFNAMTWEDVQQQEGVRINDRRRARINYVYDQWYSDFQRKEWQRVEYDTVLHWCVSHGYLSSPTDPNADAIIAQHRVDAFHAWIADHYEKLHDKYSMDKYIETEFGSMENFMQEMDVEYEQPRQLEYSDDGSTHQAVASSLANALGVKASAGTYGNINRWHVVEDGSISGDGVGAEVVSAVYSLKEALAKLHATFKWMNDNSYQTNKSTGLHVSLSILGKTNEDDYDFLKMMILFDENYTANLFNRLHESYAKQMREVLFRDMKNNDPTTLMASRNFDSIIRALRKMGKSLPSQLGSEKYYSFRHRAKGVVEFRNMGGSDYEDKFDIIRSRVITMATIMKIGSDDHLMQKEYINGVYRMLTTGKFAQASLKKVKKPEPVALPSMLSSFADIIKSDRRLAVALQGGYPSLFVTRLINALDFSNITPIQARQLRFLIASRKISAEYIQGATDGATYNAVASIMKWPLVVPGEQDPRQDPLPFALRGDRFPSGQDLSGRPREDDPETDRYARRQRELPDVNQIQRWPSDSNARRYA